MRHSVSLGTDFGPVTATWECEGSIIVVRYGDRMKRAQASDNNAANEFVAKNILQGWVSEDLYEEE